MNYHLAQLAGLSHVAWLVLGILKNIHVFSDRSCKRQCVFFICFVFLQLQVWDTAGQERFRTITQSYYRSANGVIIAYDITNKDTFNNVLRWTEDIRKYALPNVFKILIGNKKDLECNREVTIEEAQRYASQCNMIDALETSAKVGGSLFEYCRMKCSQSSFLFAPSYM